MAQEGFHATIKAIDKWDKEVRKELRAELRAAGNLIGGSARAIAGMHSKTIPGTIKVRTRIQARKVEVEVKAGSAEVPLAGLFELGNRGGSKSRSASSGGRFRHPVFGDKEVWVNQRMHPYLAPAVMAKKNAATMKVRKAVANANRTIGGV